MLFYIIIPFISAAIGWITNYIAIKMLFLPRKPQRLLFYTVQGIFPKRKQTLANRLGKVVAKDLLSLDLIKSKIDTEDNRKKLKTTLLQELKTYMQTKFKSGNPLLGMLANKSIIEQISTRLSNMLDELIPRLMAQITDKVEEVDIETIVAKRVMQFSDEKFEAMLMSVIKKELKFIEMAGAILGFCIGVVQLLLIYGMQKIGA